MEHIKFNGDFIRQRRRELNMTTTELGQAIGVGFKQIYAIESGVNRTKPERIPLLAKALKAKVREICELPTYMQISDNN